MASLEQDVRQLFAYSVLDRFGRVEDANIDFTFDPGDVYLSTFFEAFERLESNEFSEHNEELAQYARVFERFVYKTEESIARRSAAIMAAALNWMSGYSANSLVIARALQNGAEEGNTASKLLLRFLARDRMLFDEGVFGVFSVLLRSYITTGSDEALSAVVAETQKIETKALGDGDSAEYVSARLLKVVFDRLRHVSLWGSIRNRSSARGEDWTRYMQYQLETSTPLVDLWPSQRTAISKGLLDGSSSLVLRMPTSAGKTKMTELAFVNDLLSDSNRRCLYLAPFRALVTE